MSDRSFTLLEIHLGDGDIDIGPLGVLGEVDEGDGDGDTGQTSADDESDADEEISEDGGSAASRVGGLLLALGALIVVAVAVIKLLGDEEGVNAAGEDDENAVDGE